MIEIGKRKNSFVAVGDSEDEVEDTSSRGRKKIKIWTILSMIFTFSHLLTFLLKSNHMNKITKE